MKKLRKSYSNGFHNIIYCHFGKKNFSFVSNICFGNSININIITSTVQYVPYFSSNCYFFFFFKNRFLYKKRKIHDYSSNILEVKYNI